jgi:4-hydroxy-tetrahydrodipicolinate synthase
VDYAALEKLVKHISDGGVEFAVALGTTAETATLSKDEKQKVMDTIYQSKGENMGLVVGAGGNNTAQVVRDIAALDASRIDALLSVAPYYNKPNQSGIYEHFKTIAQSTDLPIILYNVPGRTSSLILPETALKLAHDFKNIIAIKEASGDMNIIMELLQNRPKGFKVFSGDDALTFSMMNLGGDGVISVVANAYPEAFSTMVRQAYSWEKMNDTREIHYQLLDITNSLFKDGNPAGIKALLEIMGIGNNVLRLPLIPVQEKHFEELKALHQKIV